MGRILYTKPSITEKEVAYATDAARNGWGERCYDYIVQFEALFREYTGSRYALATSSCTGALHMGLAALGIGPGDEVILADTNWIATVAPITYLGAKPVFVDIRPDTWCIDPELIEAAISPRTKAIIAVHLYGNLCEMDRLVELGEKRGIAVIEDAAEAIGSRWRNRPAGSIGRFGTFSFHGTKTVTTGEGGMLVTNDAALYEKVLALSNHGRRKGQARRFWPEMIGFKYKMSNIQAAIGCAQMERVTELVARKREIFAYYSERLSRHPGVSLNAEKDGTVNGYWMPTAVFDHATGITRDCLMDAFKEEDIDGREFFYPLSSLPMFSGACGGHLSHDIATRAINLPSYHDIKTEDLARVCDVVDALMTGGKSGPESPLSGHSAL